MGERRRGEGAGAETAARIAELEAALARGGPVPSRLIARALLTLLRNQARGLEGAAGGGDAAVQRREEQPEAAAAKAPVGVTGQRQATERDRRLSLERFALEDLNRWLASGTVFQIRQDFAYLNLDAMGGQVAPFRGHIRAMGFTQELGVLSGPEIRGRVFLFRKP